jgi:hypothetical protein
LNQIEELKVDPRFITEAREWASSSRILDHSITDGRGSAHGHLGEHLIHIRLPGSDWTPTYDYDLVVEGHTVDVKTQRCASQPQPHFMCNIPAYQSHQRCEYYVFVRMLEDMSRAWLVGGIRKERFFELSEFRRAGEVSPQRIDGWTFKEDCYNVAISKLGRLRSMPT